MRPSSPTVSVKVQQSRDAADVHLSGDLGDVEQRVTSDRERPVETRRCRREIPYSLAELLHLRARESRRLADGNQTLLEFKEVPGGAADDPGNAADTDGIRGVATSDDVRLDRKRSSCWPMPPNEPRNCRLAATARLTPA